MANSQRFPACDLHSGPPWDYILTDKHFDQFHHVQRLTNLRARYAMRRARPRWRVRTYDRDAMPW